MKHRSALLSVGLGLSLLSACGGPARPAITAGPAIAGLNLSGAWYSKPFGDLKLAQVGANVRGSYEDPRGPDHNGTVRGTIEGDLLRLDWIQPGNPTAALMPRRGKAWLRVARDGKTMAGRWSHEDGEDGGTWTAERSSYQ